MLEEAGGIRSYVLIYINRILACDLQRRRLMLYLTPAMAARLTNRLWERTM
jgi:hypothetical protein